MKVRFNIKRYFQVLGISLAVIIAGVAVCMGINFSPAEDDAESVDNTSTVAVANGKINVLFMGTDVEGLRTDAIMLASFNTETKEVNLLSIPRDTKMYIGNRYQKINAAHAFEKDGKIGGPTATCEVVTRLTGIPINYYVDFTFDAVAHVINELGPIEFEIPDLYGDGVGMVYDDPVQSLHINLPPGKYGEGDDCDYPGLTGEQAVWLMRYRHGNADNYDSVTGTYYFKGYTNGDTDRVEMQQKFIKAVIDQKLNAGLILKLPSIFKTISSEIKTNFTASDIITYSKYLSGFTSENINSMSLPGEYSSETGIGDIWIADMDAIREMTQTVFGYSADNITTGNPEDTSSSDKPSSSDKSSSSGSSSSKSSSSSSGSSSSSSGSSSSSSSSSSSKSGTSESSSSGSSSKSGSSSGSYKTDEDDEDYSSDGERDVESSYRESSGNSSSGSSSKYQDDDSNSKYSSDNETDEEDE